MPIEAPITDCAQHKAHKPIPVKLNFLIIDFMLFSLKFSSICRTTFPAS